MVFVLKNLGTEILEWEASIDVPWMSLDTDEGMILPGESQEIIGNINHLTKKLYQGKYVGVVIFKNKSDEQNFIRKNITLIVSPFTQKIGSSILSVEFNESTHFFKKEGF